MADESTAEAAPESRKNHAGKSPSLGIDGGPSPEESMKPADDQAKVNSAHADGLFSASEPAPDREHKEKVDPTPSTTERSGSDAIVTDDSGPPAPPPCSQDRAEGATYESETAPMESRATDLETQEQQHAARAENPPGEQQLPAASTGRDFTAPPNAGEKGSTKPAAANISAKGADPTLENPELLPNLPPPKRSIFRRASSVAVKDDEIKRKVVIPPYLSKGMVDAVQSAGNEHDSTPRVSGVPAPENPLLVFINAKSGGRLGPQLETMLVDLIAPTQVYDLSKRQPTEVLRYALGHLEREADAGDKVALAARNNLRVVVAGGDGTVGWVLGSIAAAIGEERFKVPPVAVIPLGTGNDLSRSFRWGGSTTSISRKAVRRCLARAIAADVMHLDRWQVTVKPTPARMDAPLNLPHAMRRHQRNPLEPAGKDESDETPCYEGSFWNYFSLGMDAQVAYGFHTFRDVSPWLASGRVANQVVYGGYSCIQGWFCTPCAALPVARGLRQIAKLSVKRTEAVDTLWEDLELPPNIRAIVVLNLQSYAGGRNPWGRPSSRRREKNGFLEAKSNDGVLEIVGFRDGWHTTVVLLDLHTAVRLGQARAVKLELRGNDKRKDAYMQIDGEPWQQPLGGSTDRPAVVEITCHPVKSHCLLRK